MLLRRRLNKPGEDAGPAPHRGWLRRAGLFGGLFFLVKGLLWLLLPALLMAWNSLKD